MLKKIGALLIALVLSMTIVTSSFASMMVTAMSSPVEDESENLVSVTAVGQTLYQLYADGKVNSRTLKEDTLTELGEVRCTANETDPERLEGETKPAFDRLFTKDGAPYGICTATGMLYTLLDAQGLFAPTKVEGATLDTSAWLVHDEEFPEVKSLFSFFYQEGYLYYTAVSYAQGFSSEAGRISLETGENKTFTTKNLNVFTPYEGDKVIAHVYDVSAMYSGAITQEAMKQAGQYGIFDPQKDMVENPIDIKTENQMGGYGLRGFCYGNGTLYYTDSSKIIGVDIKTGVVRTSAYTGAGLYDSFGSGDSTFYAEGFYVSYNARELKIYPLDSESVAKGALRVFGEYGTPTHKTFVKNYPEIAVEVSGNFTNSLEKLTQSMVSENDSYDVLMLMLSYMPVNRMIEKGYCADLSGYPELMKAVDEMYPNYGDAVKADGKLYGMPVDVSGTSFGVNLEIWKSLGLTEEDLPKTYSELLDFTANWVYDYGEDHPDIALFNYGQSKMGLFSSILSQYLAYVGWKGESTRFDTPVFRKLLEGLQAIDFTEFPDDSSTSMNMSREPKSLFSFSVNAGDYIYREDDVVPLYLAMQDGEESFIPAVVSILIINPKTKRMNDAVAYLKNYVENLDKNRANYMLFPENNQPVVNPNSEVKEKKLREEIEKNKKLLETADEENKAIIRDDIKHMEESFAELEKRRYNLTEENIADYRTNVAPLMYVQSQNVLYRAGESAMQEINKLLMQYIEGAIDADQLVKDLDGRLKLMELEEE